MARIISANVLIVTVALLAISCSTEDTSRSFVATNTAVVKPAYQWVQLGDKSVVIARAIYAQAGAACPSIDTTDAAGAQAAIPMQKRGQNMPPDFDVTVCEATIPNADNLASASLAGKNLKLPTKSPSRVVLLGDTGCRIKGSDAQDCNDAGTGSGNDDWDLKKTVKSAVGLGKTDLVIHVGDYVYREDPCPAEDSAKCGGSPFGRSWATWEVDFFAPAAPLLDAAPWVFARGNHEACSREWFGWYLFLDPRPLGNVQWTPQQCNATSDPFQVSFNGLDMLVLDSSEEKGLDGYYLNAINGLNGSSPVWIITHVPFWGVTARRKPSTTSQGVISAAKARNVKFLVSGHIHSFEWIQFDDAGYSPPQIVSGGGATELETFTQQHFDDGASALNAKNNSKYIDKFTFAYVDIESKKWQIKVLDQDGTAEKGSFAIDF